MGRTVRIIVALGAAGALSAPATSAAAIPDDPLFDQQWALARESALERAGAWQQSTGAGTVVAVLDTGADFGHPDLQGAYWTNPAEIAGNGIDDDRDGFVDDVHGADIVNDDGNPADDEGHGTHVAGIIAARANNGIGGAGLAPDTKLMVVKVLDEHRSGTAGGLADGIRYAIAHGARIINTSVNGDGQSRALQEAIRAAGATGALVVASSGNDGRSIDLEPSYPASYADPAIVTVGSIGEDGALSWFSNRGLVAVDLAAPGEDVLSTSNDDGYELRSGTSMAAPFVASALALIQSVRPDLDGGALKEALLAGTRRSDRLSGLLAAGSLDAAAVLRGVIGAAAAAPLSARVLPTGRATRGAILNWGIDGDTAAVATVRVYLDGRLATARAPLALDNVRVKARPGLHRWRVIAFDAANTRLAQADGQFRVRSGRRAARAKKSAKTRA